VLPDDGGYKIHPSVVSFHPNGGVVIGAAAKQRKVIDPQNTIYSVKRLIGRGYRSPEVQTAKTRVPYQIKEGANQLPMIVTRGGEFAVPEVSAIVLDHMRNIAASRLGQEVSRAVVTVPASFNDAQRSATATAGAIAGLTIVRVLNEPTAAALAYGHTRNLRETIAVYDFGGGTFDITILKLADQVYEVLGTSGDTFLGGDDLDERLVDKMVDKFLAENRIDLRTNEVSMMRLRAVAEQTKIELSRRSRAVVRVDEIAYGPNGVPLNLMIEITRDEFVSQVADIIDRTFPVCQEALSLAGLDISGISDIILVGGTTKIPYVRDQVSKFFGKAARTDVNPEDAVAVGASLQASSLEKILARPRATSQHGAVQAVPVAEESVTDSYPDVEELVADTTLSRTPPPEPRPSEPKPDTSYSVTRGGARDHFATKSAVDDQTSPAVSTVPLARLTRSNVVAPPALPAKTLFGMPPAPGSSAVPTSRGLAAQPPAVRSAPPTPDARPFAIDFAVDTSTEASTLRGSGTDDFDDLLPLGPSAGVVSPRPSPIAAAGAAGAKPSPVLLEVTPRSLGIGTVSGFCEELIRRNSRIPAATKRLFTTSRDGQAMVRIVVCQGESRRLEQNVVIGDLVLRGLPRRPRGETSIEVVFSLDTSGILQVSARDSQTGTEQHASLDLIGAVPSQDVAASRDRLQQLRR